jgi:integrase
MSFVDMAKLTTENIVVSEGIEHIVYKREKTKNVKNMKPLIIPVTPALKDILEWFKQNTSLVGNYLLPIITKDYDGEQLYDHIRTRYQRLNNNLKKLGKILGIEKNLTTYVSRHTMAMTLQGNDVSRETISAVLGHRDIKTTMTYLDSLSQNVLDRVAMLL